MTEVERLREWLALIEGCAVDCGEGCHTIESLKELIEELRGMAWDALKGRKIKNLTQKQMDNYLKRRK